MLNYANCDAHKNNVCGPSSSQPHLNANASRAAAVQQRLPARAHVSSERWGESGCRAGGLGDRPRSHGAGWWQTKPNTAPPPPPAGTGKCKEAGFCMHHSSCMESQLQHHFLQPVTENDHKANLLPVRTVSAALHSSSRAHLYPYNEAQRTELPGEKEMVELNEGGRATGGERGRAEGTRGQTNCPCGGYIYFSTRNTQTCNKVIITIQ